MRYLLVLLPLALVAPVGAADWPCWRGPHHDGISRETGLLKSWPASGPRVLWKTDLTGGYSSVVVAGGRLFTQTKDQKEDLVLCVDALTGKKLWEARHAADYAKFPSLDKRFLTGPKTTPSVDGDRVYALANTGLLQCLDVRTGKPVWERNLLKLADRSCPEYGYCNSPLVVSDVLFVHPGGHKGNSVACLNKKDGRVVWQALNDRIGWATPISIKAAGVPQLIYFTGQGGVGVSPADGKLLWRSDWKTAFDINAATPIYADGCLFLSSNYGNGGVLLRLKSKGNPEVVWKSRAMENHFSTSVLYRGHLYGFSTDRLRCVEFMTGKVKWDKAGLGKGSLLIADGLLIVLGEQGTLVLADATPKGYAEKARWQALDGTCWSVPVLANGKLYLRNERRLLAVHVVNAR
ncbi:MAG TPA: PQQ-binding-like beta-propeller repeat protein [Gemmataceae bacterium]|jgi:outer membrane protein assembly factor BamB|nr:PQQ-binding-like beta-propeller repeat protein [Gemmataceae bacterium]